MGWKDKIENIRFTIKTGDGKEYFPLWKPGEKSVEFNTSTFDFINVKDSLIERKNPRSPKYPLTFWFQGDDNIEQAEAFLRSAEDPRYWTVTHPYYGSIKGQPLSITQNDVNYNVSEITVDFWKTIVFDFPKSNLSVQDNSLVRKDAIMENAALSYAGGAPQSADIQKNKEANTLVAKSFDKVQTDETAADYQNATSQAQKSNDNLLKNPLDAIKKSQQLLNLPATYEIEVLSKVNAYKSAFLSLVKTITTVSDKLWFESMGASAISGFCNAAVNFNSETDYQVATQVESVVSDLVEIFNQYNEIIENATTSIYEVTAPYQPDATVQTQLNDLVIFTIANLYDVAFDAQQERIIYTEKDTNAILLCHKYFGSANDTNLDRFCEINGIKLRERFRIKKGRKIKYYV